MSWLRGIAYRVRTLVRASRADTELDQEIAFHVEMQTRKYVRQGISPAAASALARREFGSVTRLKDGLAEVRDGVPFAALGHDFSYALRALGRNRAFTATAVLTLALGIGATAAIYSVVHRLLLDPLPYPNANRLAYIWRTNTNNTGILLMPSGRQLETWRTGSRAFEAVEGFVTQQLTLSGTGDVPPEVVTASAITPGLTQMLGVRPVVGRPFVDDDGRTGAPPVVLLSDRFWRSRFAGSSTALGRTLTLDGKLYAIVGVMPPTFDTPQGAYGSRDLWIAMTEAGSAMAIGRLKPGVSIAAAQRELERMRREEDEPAMRSWTPRVMSAQDVLGPKLRDMLLALLGAVGIVLLIGCANVANLLLARAAARERELAIRLALGASRRQLVRHLLAESLVLAVLGGGAGMLVARYTLSTVISIRPRSLDVLASARIDGPILAFTAILSIATAFLFGLLPALRATRPSLRTALTGAAGLGMGARNATLRAALVAGQLALSVTLLVGAGLLIRSVMALYRVEPGFDPSDLYAVRMAMPASEAHADARRRAFISDLLERVRGRMPGASVTIATGAPGSYGVALGELQIEGRALVEGEQASLFAANIVPGDYFRAVGIPLRAGRPFEGRPAVDSGTIIISETMARRYWPSESAVGRRIRIGKEAWLTIVGVVGDVLATGYGPDPNRLQVYYPFTSASEVTLIVRAPTTEGALSTGVRSIVTSLDRNVLVREVSSVRTMLGASAARQRLSMTLLVVFAGVALVLATVGVYGVITYTVSQRTRELGVRMALGARPGQLFSLVLAQGLRWAVWGVALGAMGAVLAGRLLASQLFGVGPLDPVTLAGVGLLLTAVALGAASAPARRAARVSPMAALRSEQ